MPHRHSIPNRPPLPGTRLIRNRYGSTSSDIVLEGLDLTEEQAAEVLQTLWGIVEAFVDEAFGVDSFSLARPQAGSVRPPAGGQTEAERE